MFYEVMVPTCLLLLRNKDSDMLLTVVPLVQKSILMLQRNFESGFKWICAEVDEEIKGEQRVQLLPSQGSNTWLCMGTC